MLSRLPPQLWFAKWAIRKFHVLRQDTEIVTKDLSKHAAGYNKMYPIVLEVEFVAPVSFIRRQLIPKRHYQFRLLIQIGTPDMNSPVLDDQMLRCWKPSLLRRDHGRYINRR